MLVRALRAHPLHLGHRLQPRSIGASSGAPGFTRYEPNLLVEGPTVVLAPVHGKIRRARYQRGPGSGDRQTGARPRGRTPPMRREMVMELWRTIIGIVHLPRK